MTRDIIRMAREAGFIFHDAGYAPILHTMPREYSEKCFERFYALAAATEREACAKAAEDPVHGLSAWRCRENIAATIRARGQQ